MKKLLLAAFFILAALATQAQTATQQQLQGKWRLATLKDDSGSVDVIKGTWKLNEGVKDKEMIEGMYNDIVLQAQDAVLVIADDTASQVIMGQEYKAHYTLEDKEGKTYITMYEGTTGIPQIYVKDGKMFLVDEEMEMVYVPVK
jgi:hypothetical protein